VADGDAVVASHEKRIADMRDQQQVATVKLKKVLDAIARGKRAEEDEGEERQEERPKDWDCRHCTVKNAAIDKICALHRHLG
jgi:rubredoxin